MARGVDAIWDHLVDVLATIGEVSERRPRGLTVVLTREDGSTQVVDVDMTPREWDDLASIGGWHVNAGAQRVRQLVEDQPVACRYLTFSDYTLVPATTDWERD
ncbi:hypothetical protein GCM10023339_42480 [Alloalcanivorax gelatiniphagus]